MSEFVSVYEVVFSSESLPNLDAMPGWERLKYVSSSIEEEGIFYFDEYGRFGKAGGGAVGKILSAIGEYGSFCGLAHPQEIEEYEMAICELMADPEWHSFGWIKGEFPDFKECYDQWKKNNGVMGDSPMRVGYPEPAKQSRVWDFANDLLKLVLSQQAYSNILGSEAKSNDFVLAIDELDRLLNQGWSENKKKSIRSYLKNIVDKSKR